MRFTKKFNLMMLAVCLTMVFTVGYCFADDSPVQPADFFSAVVKTIQAFGGLSWAAKIAGILTLVVSSFKVSFLNDLIWSKLGAFKVWVAPILGLVLGAFAMNPFSWQGAVAYALSGAGAVFFHEILDSLKAIPGLGAAYVALINTVQGLLGGPEPQKLPAKP